MTEKIDFSYEISEERLRAYSRVSLYDRLRWLDDLCRFTAMMRGAKSVDFGKRAKAPTSGG
jgi:hypothetical protein